MYLNYHNIENFKFPSSEEIFLQPSSWNEYTGYDKYVSYGWWSPISSLKYFLGNLDIINTEDMGWIDSSINEDLKSLDNFSCKVIWTEDVSYFSENVMDSFSSFIEINNIRFNDVEFLIKFEYDKGDPSVGLWFGYNALLVLNNNLPIYRSIESVGLYEKKKFPDKLTLFNRFILEKLGLLEGQEWLKSQINNYEEGSFLSAFLFYEKEKIAAREDEYLTSILGKSEYLVLGNGEVVIKNNHHALNDAKNIGFRVI